MVLHFLIFTLILYKVTGKIIPNFPGYPMNNCVQDDWQNNSSNSGWPCKWLWWQYVTVCDSMWQPGSRLLSRVIPHPPLLVTNHHQPQTCRRCLIKFKSQFLSGLVRLLHFLFLTKRLLLWLPTLSNITYMFAAPVTSKY